MSNDDAPSDGIGETDDASSANQTTVLLDSCFYLEYLKGPESEFFQAVEVILDAFKAGTVEVAVSALTITEVLWIKCDEDDVRVMIDRAREPDIIDMFQGYAPRKLRLVELDRPIAEAARKLVWEKNIKPKDAIHVASAVAAGVEVMFTTDKKLWRHTGAVGGVPALRIERPRWLLQTSLPATEPPPAEPPSESDDQAPDAESPEPAVSQSPDP